jgi:hypothetical protein
MCHQALHVHFRTMPFMFWTFTGRLTTQITHLCWLTHPDMWNFASSVKISTTRNKSCCLLTIIRCGVCAQLVSAKLRPYDYTAGTNFVPVSEVFEILSFSLVGRVSLFVYTHRKITRATSFFGKHSSLVHIVTCYLRSQPVRGSLLGNSFVNTQQYWSRC